MNKESGNVRLLKWLFGARGALAVVFIAALTEATAFIMAGNIGPMLFTLSHFVVIPILCIMHMSVTVYILAARKSEANDMLNALSVAVTGLMLYTSTSIEFYRYYGLSFQ